ncbi:MAG: phosphoribosyl-ATP diphosphatase [Candidatus Vogelbacteria bacterium]|nr:phosphoribosyl-ATP diphosphatase [Candidatus Vogelbacteria bacterium]
MDTLNELFATIKDRQQKMPEGSYTAELLKSGIDRICQKVGEEGVETVIAGMKQAKKEIAYEMADLWYHCLVLLAVSDLTPETIYQELQNRFKSNETK